MALAKECDACGRFFKPSSDETIANGITYTYFDFEGRAQNTIDKKELCPSCLDAVYDILNKNK